MTEERKIILDKVNQLLNEKIGNLIKKIPDIHEIDDGIIIRYFNEWGVCHDNENIKYKVISNNTASKELILFHFIPKNTILLHKKREYVRSIICLSGNLELRVNNNLVVVNKYTKTCIDDIEFNGIALEDTYLLTSNKPCEISTI